MQARQAKRLIGLALAGALAAPLAWAKLNPEKPKDRVAIERKIHCNTKDEELEYYTWKGTAWSRVAGERDRKLFQVEGMNVRQCVTHKDKKRGVGYRMVSREIMLYLDPDTGEVLRTWTNPWTGKEVDVIHVANDPVNSRGINYGTDEDGKPMPSPVEVRGGKYFMDIVVPLFYPNPLGGAYQPYVGNFYHSAEIFNFSGPVDELLNERVRSVSPTVSWVRMAPWLPWMEMAGRDGLMYFSATGHKLDGWDDMPEVLKREIAANYPAYRRPPPTNDKRRNQTSWTFFKQELDKRAKQDGRRRR